MLFEYSGYNFFSNSYATSTLSNKSSLIVPVKAKFKAISSLPNLGHNTPGVSKALDLYLF